MLQEKLDIGIHSIHIVILLLSETVRNELVRIFLDRPRNYDSTPKVQDYIFNFSFEFIILKHFLLSLIFSVAINY
jgi:hypothetical protein